MEYMVITSHTGAETPILKVLIPRCYPRAITHDPNVYHDPEAFEPERFLDERDHNIDHEEKAAFGYGRRHVHFLTSHLLVFTSLLIIRECVGMHFAKDTLWFAVASILAVFDFKKSKMTYGNDIPIKSAQTDGLVR